MKLQNRSFGLTIKLIAVSIWLIFSISLAAWLYIFSSRQVEKLAAAIPEYADQLTDHHRMLVLETATLLICLLGGGLAIAYFIYQDRKQSNRTNQFFLILSHELKTAITSLQLQLEYISDPSEQPPSLEQLQNLKKDISRLAFQLENSLYLAEDTQAQLLFQPQKLNDCFTDLAVRLPELEIIAPKQDITLMSDRRALDSILLNIGQNARQHGQASNLTITLRNTGNFIEIELADNGTGFSGDRQQLGKFMQRLSSTSGSAIGLHLACQLAKRLGGELTFPEGTTGFIARLKLPKT